MATAVTTEEQRALRALRRRRRRLQASLEQVERDLADAVCVADRAGMPRLRIAQEAGLARQTVYDMLAGCA